MGRLRLGFFAIGVAATAMGAYACLNSDDSAITCQRYCTDIQATCTGVDQQYADEPTCEKFCAQMDPGEAGASGGDTVACREIQISNAKDELTADLTHNDCVNGGPSSNCSASPSTPPQDQCTAFCTLDLALCGTQRTGYADVNACVATCLTWGQSFAGQLLDSTGNTLQCRTYHLELSQTGNAADLETHCPHTGACSERCNNGSICDDADGGTDGASDAGTD
ncbi:MAG TPA: hypothetical protein VGH28_33275 [Polyangiaceae bacterium]